MDLVPLPKSRFWRGKSDFRLLRTAGPGENIDPLYDPQLHHGHDVEPDLKDLNASLAALVDVFPNIEPEVFREMLLSISDESRVEVVTEHLLKMDAKWVRGRYRTGRRECQPLPKQNGEQLGNEPTLTTEDGFRSESYRKAVKQVLYEEFRNLSHSSIKAVMAEQNYSYTRSRPILQQLATKSWRFTLANLWGKRSPSQAASEHPNIVRQSGEPSQQSAVIGVRRTGNAQLDHELWELFVEPVMAQQRRERLAADHTYASELSEAQAEEVGELFDCECCYGSVPFEQVVTCDEACHQLCFDCVRRTVKEALYGQGWSRTADLGRSTVRCFAPANVECQGCIPAGTVSRALSGGDGNDDTWQEFQGRVTRDALTKSMLRLQRCPFCNYAEADEVPAMTLKHWMGMWLHFATRLPVALQIMVLSMLGAALVFTVSPRNAQLAHLQKQGNELTFRTLLQVPILILASVVWLAAHIVPAVGAVFDASWARVYRRRRGLKFRCRNPSCGKTSCARCAALWRDPHTCFENEKTSLRTAIESSATAAIKRTCPRCLLSFVKASGCNELVCNCGYTMCYICRNEITSKEGYSHFCQHFRPGGGHCGECERCDLYGDEDEEAAIRRAADMAEKDWRAREGAKGEQDVSAQLMVEALVGRARHRTWQDTWLDALVDAVAA
ncbi:hypothetical protein LTR85_012191 [Meristemomyces frigidus]|nr:hypothetical protein LTR85_012191 [Meristemomyces frigidus]